MRAAPSQPIVPLVLGFTPSVAGFFVFGACFCVTTSLSSQYPDISTTVWPPKNQRHEDSPPQPDPRGYMGVSDSESFAWPEDTSNEASEVGIATPSYSYDQHDNDIQGWSTISSMQNGSQQPSDLPPAPWWPYITVLIAVTPFAILCGTQAYFCSFGYSLALWLPQILSLIIHRIVWVEYDGTYSGTGRRIPNFRLLMLAVADDIGGVFCLTLLPGAILAEMTGRSRF